MNGKKRREAFTLVELIVVLAILAVLMALLVPRVTQYMYDARETAAIHNANAVMDAARMYALAEERSGRSAANQSLNNSGLESYLDNQRNTLSYQVGFDANGSVSSGQVTSDGITIQLPTLLPVAQGE